MKNKILYFIFIISFILNVNNSFSQSKKYTFRINPLPLHDHEIEKVIKKYDFFHAFKNKEGKGINHAYSTKKIKGDFVVIDEATGLMWQQSEYRVGTRNEFGNIMIQLNSNGYAGYSDWRLPILEEALSLLESNPTNFKFFINPIFKLEQGRIWTADKIIGLSGPAMVDFKNASYGCPAYSYIKYAILAVRSCN